MKKEKLQLEDVTIEKVKSSEFGCRNCLWAGAECTKSKMFKAKISQGKPSCESYTYYD